MTAAQPCVGAYRVYYSVASVLFHRAGSTCAVASRDGSNSGCRLQVCQHPGLTRNLTHIGKVGLYSMQSLRVPTRDVDTKMESVTVTTRAVEPLGWRGGRRARREKWVSLFRAMFYSETRI